MRQDFQCAQEQGGARFPYIEVCIRRPSTRAWDCKILSGFDRTVLEVANPKVKALSSCRLSQQHFCGQLMFRQKHYRVPLRMGTIPIYDPLWLVLRLDIRAENCCGLDIIYAQSNFDCFVPPRSQDKSGDIKIQRPLSDAKF